MPPSPDTPAPDRWDDWANAEMYADFAGRDGIYRALNERLAALADLTTARRLLDIACGTGATAESCLARMAKDAELVGVDGSEAMVAVAAARVDDPRARFVVARAGAVGAAVDGRFDRLVANAALWQLPASEGVLRDLARVAAPGARFVFNLPASRMDDERASVHPFQVALARTIEERSGAGSRGRAEMVTEEQLARRLDAAGWTVERIEDFVYRGRQAELIELMALPAMIADAAPDLSPGERSAAVRDAGGRVDRDATVSVPWKVYIAVKTG